MSQPDDDGNYGVSVLLFCIGALVELLTEPLVILGQAHQYVTTKVSGWGRCYMPCHVCCCWQKGIGGGCITIVQVCLHCCHGDVVSPMGHDGTVYC